MKILPSKNEIETEKKFFKLNWLDDPILKRFTKNQFFVGLLGKNHIILTKTSYYTPSLFELVFRTYRVPLWPVQS